jgi:hypothetical protein
MYLSRLTFPSRKECCYWDRQARARLFLLERWPVKLGFLSSASPVLILSKCS